jgi:hypothetical protein
MAVRYQGTPPTLAQVLRQDDLITARCQRHTCMHAAEARAREAGESYGVEF